MSLKSHVDAQSIAREKAHLAQLWNQSRLVHAPPTAKPIAESSINSLEEADIELTLQGHQLFTKVFLT